MNKSGYIKISHLLICILALLLIVGVFFAFRILNSPEYALLKIAQDVKESGVDGLMPHLTEDAQETVSTIETITESKLLNSILTLFGKDDYTSVLKSNLEKVKWSLEDLLKSKTKADVVLGFDYEDKLVGTIEVSMIKEDDGWKIYGIELPEFTKIDFKE